MSHIPLIYTIKYVSRIHLYTHYTSHIPHIRTCIGIDRVITLSSTDLTYSAMTIRQLGLDVLVYPEIGADPVRYAITYSIICSKHAVYVVYINYT